VRGVFLTFEGPDGAGKTTQLGLLEQALTGRGYAVVRTREPGGDAVGEQVRRMLLDREAMTPEAEFLLFAASRAQNVAEVIVPALEAGKIVLCDRFTDSSLAYQGYGRGLSRELIRAANAFATRGLTPDKTFLLDVPVQIGKARRAAGETNRLDREAEAFHARVREGYLAVAAAEPERIVTLDGTQPVDVVYTALWDAIAGVIAVAMTAEGLKTPR